MGDGGQHPAAVLDMSNAAPGEHTFSIGAANVRLSRGMHIMRAIPSQVRLAFEQRLERSVPVVVRLRGQSRYNYRVASATAEPEQVAILGPRSHVARITSVVTDPVDVSLLTATGRFQMNIYAGDPFVRFRSMPHGNRDGDDVRKSGKRSSPGRDAIRKSFPKGSLPKTRLRLKSKKFSWKANAISSALMPNRPARRPGIARSF